MNIHGTQTGRFPKNLYIFDLDGTLCDITHRLRHIQCKPPQWKAFYADCPDDRPKLEMIVTMEALKDSGAEIWIFSGRSDEVRNKTVDWIIRNTALNINYLYSRLVMRPAGDFTKDSELKQLWYDRMLDEDKARLVCVFDDRQQVVDMWRSNGVTCCQVAKGDF